MRILLTGSSGFVGSRLATTLSSESCYHLRTASRSTKAGKNRFKIDIQSESNWREALQGVNTVIHAAARAHVMKDEAADPLTEFRKINVEGTLNLAHQASCEGVRRFIYLSSIKVNGEKTEGYQSFKAHDIPCPADPYGISKMEAEYGLQEICRETGMELVIIRPPLVYGPGVKGNFFSMIKMVEKGLPLPLGSVHNKRSLVALDNLIDLIVTCIDHPAAANQVFLAGDGQDLSTTELLKGVAKAMGKPSRLVPIPDELLMFCATVLGKKAVAQRLLGSLRVDISKARNLLDWQPPLSVDEGLKRCFADQ